MEKLSKVREWLKGKKTYIIAIGGILSIAVAVIMGDMGLKDGLYKAVDCILAMTIRAGVTNG